MYKSLLINSIFKVSVNTTKATMNQHASQTICFCRVHGTMASVPNTPEHSHHHQNQNPRAVSSHQAMPMPINSPYINHQFDILNAHHHNYASTIDHGSLVRHRRHRQRQQQQHQHRNFQNSHENVEVETQPEQENTHSHHHHHHYERNRPRHKSRHSSSSQSRHSQSNQSRHSPSTQNSNSPSTQSRQSPSTQSRHRHNYKSAPSSPVGRSRCNVDHSETSNCCNRPAVPTIEISDTKLKTSRGRSRPRRKTGFKNDQSPAHIPILSNDESSAPTPTTTRRVTTGCCIELGVKRMSQKRQKPLSGSYSALVRNFFFLSCILTLSNSKI